MRKETADKILYEKGLYQELSKYGKPHIIGIYYLFFSLPPYTPRGSCPTPKGYGRSFRESAQGGKGTLTGDIRQSVREIHLPYTLNEEAIADEFSE